MKITLRVDYRNALRALRDVRSDQIPFASALALTWTAKDAEQEVVLAAARLLDRPTRFTLGSTRTEPAQKEKLESAVLFRDFAPKGTPAAKYLQAPVHGGARRHKRFERALIAAGVMTSDEYAVPARGYPLDSHGNLPGPLLTKILSGLRASRDATQNITAKSRRRHKGKRSEYFVPRGGTLPRGVYERRGRMYRAVLIFVRGAPQYEAQYPFYGIVEKAAVSRLPENLRRAIERTVQTQR